MFDNIGRKIRALARIVFFVGILGSGIGMLVMWITGGGLANRVGGFTIFVTGLIIGLLGCLASWACGCVLYGFGQLVEDAEAIRQNTEDTQYCTESLRRMAEEYRRFSGLRERQPDEIQQ